MGGAVYWRDENGNVHKASVDNPLPVSDAGGVQASSISADAPLTWDASTTTIGITQDAAGGVPILDASGLIKLDQMPISGLNYHGHWDASTNTPTLADGTGNSGDMYRVHVAGSQDLGSGSITFDVGDLVIYEGAIWQKFAAATGVISVNGQTGAVSLAYSDFSDRPIVRDSGTVALHLAGEELVWPNDIVNGKIRLWNTTAGSNNTYYGFGIDNGALVYQVDSDTSHHRFQGVDDSDGAIQLLEMSSASGAVFHVDVHMSEKKISNVGAPAADKDAATKAYVDDAVSGAGSGAATWGSITGTLTDQTDLKSALDDKLGLDGGTLTGDLHSSAAIESTTAVRAVAVVGTSYIASQGNVTATDEIESDTGLTLKATTTPPSVTSAAASIYTETVNTEQQLVAQWPDGTTYVFAKQGAPEAAAGLLSVAVHTEANPPNISTGDPQVQLYDLSAASNSQDVNLPTDAPAGTVFTLKKIDSSSNGLFMFAEGGQLIDGQDSASIQSQHGSRTLVFDGTNWHFIASVDP